MHHRLIIFTLLSIIIVSAGLVVAFVMVSQPKLTTTTSCPISSASKNQYQWSTGPGPYRDQISYATSADLLHWTASGVILVEHTSVPDAIVKDGVIWAYFVDVTQEGKPEQIGVLRSADLGQTWSEKVFIEIIGGCNVVPVDPSPFLLPDGRIRLYFPDFGPQRSGNKGDQIQIRSAISSDGLQFTMEDGIRFERVGGQFDPSVVLVDGVYHMYVGTKDGQQVISATSTDGLTFTEEGVAYSGSAVPEVYYDGTRYILYTAGIEMASSTDGKTFTKLPNRFSAPGGMTADPGVVQLGDGQYLMVYKTQASQK